MSASRPGRDFFEITRHAGSLEPGHRLECFEDPLGSGEQRLGIGISMLSGQPLAQLQRRDRRMEGHRHATEAFDGLFEHGLDGCRLATATREPGREPSFMGLQERCLFSGFELIPLVQQFARTAEIVEREGGFDSFDETPP